MFPKFNTTFKSEKSKLGDSCGCHLLLAMIRTVCPHGPPLELVKCKPEMYPKLPATVSPSFTSPSFTAVSPSCSVPKLQVAAPFGSGVLRDWQRRRHNRGPSAPRPADFRRYGDTPPLCSPLWGHTTYVPDNLDPIVQRVDTAGKPLAC